MDREEALKLLRGGQEGVAEWNRLREEGGEIPSLSEAHLYEAKLSRADLSGADLSGADLSGASLWRANLSGANLRGAKLGGANLGGANLRGANFRGARLVFTNLQSAHVNGAQFAAAHFGSTVVACNLSGALGLDEVSHGLRSVVAVSALRSFTDDLPEKFLRGCGLTNEEIADARARLGSPIRFYSCFISYSHEDKAFALRLHDQLQGEGIRCWLDSHDMKIGADIYDAVDRAIRVSDRIVLCCSKNSLESDWVEREISRTLRKEEDHRKQTGDKLRCLLPLDLDGYLFNGWSGGRAGVIKDRLAADFTGWESDTAKFEASFERVVRALRTDEGAREEGPKAQP